MNLGHQLEKEMLYDLGFGSKSYTWKCLEDKLLGEDLDTISSFAWGKIPSKIIQSSGEILESESSTIYLPLSKNFPAIDAIIVLKESRLIYYVQCTVAKKHPILYDHLSNLYNVLNKTYNSYSHALLFVVPLDCYDGFKIQPYCNTNKTIRKSQRNIPVRQFVLAYS